ncbi:MAG: LLM class F420-dependent oxidoreductase [bacterium]
MKIGIFAAMATPFASPEYVQALGAAADERGFHSIWVGEHVVLFDDYGSRYPYADDGKITIPEESGLLDPFAVLNLLAGVTRHVRLGTGVCLVPQRNPVYTAKAVATLDWLSQGRFDFGVGIGWLEEEFRALEAPFPHRAARTRSYLEVMRRLWCDPVSEYADEFYTLPACRQYPKPVQQPHPPIHFGGESDAALKRVADLGQGWFGFNAMPDAVATCLTKLDALLAARGRSRRDVEISICPYMLPCDFDQVQRYRDAGVEQVVLMPIAFDADSLRAALDHLAETIVEPAQRL